MIYCIYYLLFLLLPLLTTAKKYILVQNNCNEVLSVGVLTNGDTSSRNTGFDLQPWASKQFEKSEKWGGRVWGRHGCSGSNADREECGIPSAANPASLAEFFFKGVYSQDFYDISLVDGYNLPMRIEPAGDYTQDGNYYCGQIECRLSGCPERYAVRSATGRVISCQSSCSASNSAKDCCTGNYDDPSICSGGSHSQNVKRQCPDAYSYAYDDATSTFACSSQGYVVTFC